MRIAMMTRLKVVLKNAALEKIKVSIYVSINKKNVILNLGVIFEIPLSFAWCYI